MENLNCFHLGSYVEAHLWSETPEARKHTVDWIDTKPVSILKGLATQLNHFVDGTVSRVPADEKVKYLSRDEVLEALKKINSQTALLVRVAEVLGTRKAAGVSTWLRSQIKSSIQKGEPWDSKGDVWHTIYDVEKFSTQNFNRVGGANSRQATAARGGFQGYRGRGGNQNFNRFQTGTKRPRADNNQNFCLQINTRRLLISKKKYFLYICIYIYDLRLLNEVLFVVQFVMHLVNSK